MPVNIKTDLFCFDEHRDFTEEIRKKFCDESRYRIYSYQSDEEFIRNLPKDKDSRRCTIAILYSNGMKDQADVIEKIIIAVKSNNRQSGVILLCPPDRIEDVRKLLKINVDAYFARNSSSVLRIHNLVKKMMSEHNIGIFRKKRNLSLIVLATFIIFSALVFIVLLLRFPDLF